MALLGLLNTEDEDSMLLETVVTIYWWTQCNMTEDINLYDKVMRSSLKRLLTNIPVTLWALGVFKQYPMFLSFSCYNMQIE